MCLVCYYDLSDPKRLKVVCKDNIKFQKMIMLVSTDCEFSTLSKSNMDFVHVAMGPAKQTHFPVFLPSRVGHMIKFWLMKISRNGMCLLYLCFFFIFGVRRKFQCWRRIATLSAHNCGKEILLIPEGKIHGYMSKIKLFLFGRLFKEFLKFTAKPNS